MAKWFQSLSRLAQIVLLLIPGVNWVTEIVVRWSAFLTNKKGTTLIMAILVTFLGLAIGWVDVVWCLLFRHMIFAKV